MSCIDEVDICIIRGDAFTKDVGLTASYSEVLENPNDYQMSMVFREFQDDSLMPYLTLTADAEVNPDPLPGDLPVMFRFSATPAETESLPDWDIVGYCELVYTGSDPAIATPVRLFNMNVEVHS